MIFGKLDHADNQNLAGYVLMPASVWNNMAACRDEVCRSENKTLVGYAASQDGKRVAPVYKYGTKPKEAAPAHAGKALDIPMSLLCPRRSREDKAKAGYRHVLLCLEDYVDLMSDNDRPIDRVIEFLRGAGCDVKSLERERSFIDAQLRRYLNNMERMASTVMSYTQEGIGVFYVEGGAA
jgi:hypothetical protein